MVEGYTDVIALVQAGVTNVVASMGTAFTEEQLKRLTRHTRNLFLCFDADAAGLGAMNRALELARRLGATMHVVRIPDGLDPADYVLAGNDGEAFGVACRSSADSATVPDSHRACFSRPSDRGRSYAGIRRLAGHPRTGGRPPRA